MGFLSFFRRASTNHATAAEDQGEYSDEKDTASAKRFLSSFCCISWGHTTDAVEEQQEKAKPRDKPPKYNRHNLPSMVIEDPPPWVTNYRKLERRSDGELQSSQIIVSASVTYQMKTTAAAQVFEPKRGHVYIAVHPELPFSELELLWIFSLPHTFRRGHTKVSNLQVKTRKPVVYLETIGLAQCTLTISESITGHGNWRWVSPFPWDPLQETLARWIKPIKILPTQRQSVI